MGRRELARTFSPAERALPRVPSVHASGTPARKSQAWSPLTQFATISVVLLASYNVSAIVSGTSFVLAWLSGASSQSKFGGHHSLADNAPRDLPSWEGPKAPKPKEQVPVVMYYGRPGEMPCNSGHIAYVALAQAQKHNDLVYFIGPRECRQFLYTFGVAFEEYAEYEEVYEWFLRNIGSPVHIHVRWFILKAFMERHGFGRVLSITPEVLLFANATEAAAWMFPSSHLVLPARWPTLMPPARPNQTPSTTVSTHVALMSYVALSDWCLFLLSFFQLSLFGGDLASENVPLMPLYSDSHIMGWYTYPECWEKRSGPACLGEPERELSPELGSRLVANRVLPRFRVDSFCQPRVCHNSSWSNQGRCAWDCESLAKSMKGQIQLESGAKCPTSRKFPYFEVWSKEEQKETLQLLAVHFRGKGREDLKPLTRFAASA